MYTIKDRNNHCVSDVTDKLSCVDPLSNRDIDTVSIDILGAHDSTDIDVFLLIETMRCANEIIGEARYKWRFISSSNHNQLSHSSNAQCDILVVPTIASDTVNACSEISQQIRHYYRLGAKICALGKGLFHVGAAGIIRDQTVTMPSKYMSVFKEQFPLINMASRPYINDRRILSCSGGVNVIHLFAHLISEDRGREVALKIADFFQLERLRHSDEILPRSQNFRNALPPSLARSVELMEITIEMPRPLLEIAHSAQISIRHMERLFSKHLKCSPSDYYRRLRLNHGRVLLEASNYSVTQVTYMCGFASPSHFTKCFRDAFGICPSDARGGL